jgi:hypothetical protein
METTMTQTTTPRTTQTTAPTSLSAEFHLSRESVEHKRVTYHGGTGVPPMLSLAAAALSVLVARSDTFDRNGWEGDAEAHVAAAELMHMLDETDDESGDITFATLVEVTTPVYHLFQSRTAAQADTGALL